MTTLVDVPDRLAKHTGVRLTDAITALTRGVAEYVQSRPAVVDPGGREIHFTECLEAWADPNDTVEDSSADGQYPRLVVWTDQKGAYDPTGLARKVVGTDAVSEDGQFGLYLVSGAELVVDLYADVWATDAAQRQQLVGLLEDAFDPLEWMAGFRLDLPHYFNQRATFLAKDVQYLDDELKATQGYRQARVTLTASLPKCTLVRLPLARVRPQVTAQTQPLTAAPTARRVIGDSVKR